MHLVSQLTNLFEVVALREACSRSGMSMITGREMAKWSCSASESLRTSKKTSGMFFRVMDFDPDAVKARLPGVSMSIVVHVRRARLGWTKLARREIDSSRQRLIPSRSTYSDRRLV